MSDAWAVCKIILDICASDTLGLTHSLHRIYILYALANKVIEQRRILCTQRMDLLLED